MTVGASDEFYELLVYAFACCAKHGNMAKPLESAYKFIPHLKRDKLTDLLVSLKFNKLSGSRCSSSFALSITLVFSF